MSVQATPRWAMRPAREVISQLAASMQTYGEGDQRSAPQTPPGVQPISFGAGFPDPQTFPYDALLEAARRALQKDGAAALRYGLVQGDPSLREWIAAHLVQQGHALSLGVENIAITNGSAQAIGLVFEALLDPGDVVLVEVPSYSGGMRSIRAAGGEVIGVATDEQGLIPEALEETVKRLQAEGRRVKALYTIPTFQNPTGCTIPLERRKRIAAILDESAVLIVEDDAYGDLRYEGERVPSFLAITQGQGALRLGSFSKTLATGLRIGYVAGRQDFVDAVTRIRYDLGLSPWLQRLVFEYAATGELERHIEQVIPLYREKRDRMLASLAERCSLLATWSKPEGGFYIWLKLADDIDGTRVPAALTGEGVIAFPGANFFPDRSGTQYVRLCFSTAALEEIDEGVRRLGRALEKCRRV